MIAHRQSGIEKNLKKSGGTSQLLLVSERGRRMQAGT